KKLAEQKDDKALTRLLTTEPYLREMANVENKTKRQQGFVRAYGAGVWNCRKDFQARGDLKGIPGLIADMESELGLVIVRNTNIRRVGREYWQNEPIKFLGLTRGDRSI